MSAWNLVVQLDGASGAGSIQPQCLRFSVTGLSRPCRILFYACHSTSAAPARAAYQEAETALRSYGAIPDFCGGPGMWGCMTWGESSCLQILVPVVDGPITGAIEADLLRWQKRAGNFSVIMPALMPTISHGAAFSGCGQAVSRLNTVPWQGSVVRLAAVVVQRALQLEKPGLFISYRRSDAAALADQVYDKMAHCGFRVFLDRYSGTSGRYFPGELAEEMADKAVLLVIETQNILKSKWTLWEVGFAHRYRLGLVALNLPSAPVLSRISAANRLSVSPEADGTLSDPDLAGAVDFIQRAQVIAGLRRAAFYEGLVTGAASRAGGSVRRLGDGVLELRNRAGHASAAVLPSGRPGQLADVRRLCVAGSGAPAHLLLGQHRHLPASAQADLTWLAGRMSVDLFGRYDGCRRVQQLC